MARCEDCLHFEVCQALEQGNGIMRVHPLHCGCYKPAADVAPRAEIDKLQEAYADLNESLRLAAEANKDLQAVVDRLRLNLKEVLDERAEDKAEVAREIFEEIDKFLKEKHQAVDDIWFDIEDDDDVLNAFCMAKTESYFAVKNFIDELKKKYTATTDEPPKGD